MATEIKTTVEELRFELLEKINQVEQREAAMYARAQEDADRRVKGFCEELQAAYRVKFEKLRTEFEKATKDLTTNGLVEEVKEAAWPEVGAIAFRKGVLAGALSAAIVIFAALPLLFSLWSHYLG